MGVKRGEWRKRRRMGAATIGSGQWQQWAIKGESSVKVKVERRERNLKKRIG